MRSSPGVGFLGVYVGYSGCVTSAPNSPAEPFGNKKNRTWDEKPFQTPPKKKMPFIFLPRIFFRLANFPLDFFSSDFSASEIGLAFFFPPCQFCIAFLCPENFPRLINSAVFKNKIASLVSLSSLMAKFCYNCFAFKFRRPYCIFALFLGFGDSFFPLFRQILFGG